ncbi:competence protein CoiA [Metabacillus arenae]|uniref:Competence protein CoiA n=1 Tax=Metabacillus arenae TaxID=2771434 RepID=A0A926NL54_9BACI|nr:competence protein CoiA family protein [Metabacillus arenae]MBD1383065.1 hypothetical protein [Metabacillus arenae]
MFIAQDEKGKIFSLADYQDKPHELLHVKKSKRFFCPICKNGLELKLGKIRTFHFAHKKTESCSYHSELESEEHRNGKLHLYHWLKKQDGVTARLEHYLPDIMQRPDTYFQCHNGQFAIEFQCSTIDQTLFRKRTQMYLEKRITPIWIVSSKYINKSSSTMYRFSPFLWLFLQQAGSSTRILAYHTSSESLLHLSSIVSFTKQNAAANMEIIKLSELNITSLLNRQPEFRIPKDWLIRVKNHRLKPTLHETKEDRNFREKLYIEKQLSIQNLPSKVFIPVMAGYVFENHVFQWQTYILLFLDKFSLHTSFTTTLISKHLKFLLNKEYLKKRYLINSPDLSLPIRQYLDALCTFNYLKKTKDNTYIKVKPFDWNDTIDNLLKRDKQILIQKKT